MSAIQDRQFFRFFSDKYSSLQQKRSFKLLRLEFFKWALKGDTTANLLQNFSGPNGMHKKYFIQL